MGDVLSKEEILHEKEMLLQKLTNCEVDVNEKYKSGKPKKYYPIGHCFKKACDYIIDCDSDKVLLCHGYYLPPGNLQRCGHAWVEIEEIVVFDGNLQRFYCKEEYYKALEVNKRFDYTRMEAINKMLEHESWGEPVGAWNIIK